MDYHLPSEEAYKSFYSALNNVSFAMNVTLKQCDKSVFLSQVSVHAVSHISVVDFCSCLRMELSVFRLILI